MAAKRTTIFLLEQDLRLIRMLQSRYGLTTQSDVIRFALRLTGETTATQGKKRERLSTKRIHQENSASGRQQLLAQARAVSAQASALQHQVDLYLKTHKR